MSHDVFVCHSSKDLKTAQAVCDRLERGGVGCWIAPRDVSPGKEWAAQIIDALAGAKLVVLVFSNHANESAEVLREVKKAFALSKTVVPFRIESITPSSSLDYYLGPVHWLDVSESAPERGRERLFSVVEGVLGRSGAVDAPAPPSLAHPVDLRPARRLLAAKHAPQAVALGLGLIGFVGGTSWLVLRIVHPGRPVAKAVSDASEIASWSHLRTFLPGPKLEYSSVAWTPNGRWLAAAVGKDVAVWKVQDGRRFLTAVEHTENVDSVAWSSDGRWLASASTDDDTVQVFDASKWNDAHNSTIVGSARSYRSLGSPKSLAWSPDGRWLACGSYDQNIRLWRAATGELERTIPVVDSSASGTGVGTESRGGLRIAVGGAITGIAWSPDSRLIASSSCDDRVRVTDVGTGKVVRTLTGHAGQVRGVAWSPDGRWIASASLDHTVRVWDAQDGKEAQTLDAYKGLGAKDEQIWCVAWSSDSRWLATGATSGPVQVWDVAKGRLIKNLQGDESELGPVFGLAWSPDGKSLAGASVGLQLWGRPSVAPEVFKNEYACLPDRRRGEGRA